MKLGNIFKGKTTTETSPETKKNAKPTTAVPSAATDSPPSRSPQFSQQKAVLKQLHFEMGIVDQDPSKSFDYDSLLETMQTSEISQMTAQCFSEEQLNNFRNYTKTELESLSRVNHERVQSLFGLAEEPLVNSIYESVFLFDINPEAGTSLELSEKEGGDPQGEALENQDFQPFFKNALHGVASAERYLPPSSDQNPGLKGYVNKEYPDLAGTFQSSSSSDIKALTTIGSLGGIGHKPDSDMDMQVICDTDPQFSHPWNDADFFIALLMGFMNAVVENTMTQAKEEQQEQIENTIKEQLRQKYGEGLTEHERQIIHIIFPGSYEQARRHTVWKHFQTIDSVTQTKLMCDTAAEIIPNFPVFYKYAAQLTAFFPALKSISAANFCQQYYPHCVTRFNQALMEKWLIRYYHEKVLTQPQCAQILKNIAQQNQVQVTALTAEKKHNGLLEHLLRSPHADHVIIHFLNYLMSRIPIDAFSRIDQIVECSRQILKNSQKILKKQLGSELESVAKIKFKLQSTQLAEARMFWHATEKEAETHYPTHMKIKVLEAYLTRKYPAAEVHFFLNILRRQRAGLHTPFLVSPEGSLAYALLLNDFLLNPAVFLCGPPPMPFDLPHDFKLFCKIGVFDTGSWTFDLQKADASRESLTLASLSDWGQLELPRNVIWEHAIPVFLRESEKVSHRNLPKALLNCWWLEMLCCLEEDAEVPTSLTRLLLNPERRIFIKIPLDHPWVQAISGMEQTFPQLVRDPWWLKFTEMLMRFQNKEIRQQIIFCFAQHIRISDIIDFNNEAKPVWIDKQKASWRTLAMLQFYDIFFSAPQDRINLAKFSQGRDDVGNEVEMILKRMFVESMRRVENKLLKLGHHRAAKALHQYLTRQGLGEALSEELSKLLNSLLPQTTPHLVVADEKLIQKRQQDSDNLTSMEKLQIQEIQQDRSRLKKAVEMIMFFCGEHKIPVVAPVLAKHIHGTRVKIAGEPLENVIFKYHFEKNFERKLFQVPLPISKSLSIPRNRIMLEFDATTEQWQFKSILSKKEVKQMGGSAMNREESEMVMFSEALVQGLARCVFSGYLGYGATNSTSFLKLPAKGNSLVGTNPVNSQELELLAHDIHDFFRPISIKPYELLDHIHYIREIMIICNVNRFNTLSMIVRDNLNEAFVLDQNIDAISIKFDQKHMVSNDKQFPSFFQRFNTKECRQQFLDTLNQLEIPLNANHPPKCKVWCNTGSFEIPIAPKFYRVYLNGIASTLWPLESLREPAFLTPLKLDSTLDSLGKQAIQQFQALEAKKQELRDKANQKNARRTREYMSKRARES
ncbi:MAG: hypothetical protein HQM11_14240 [SAR324 cluster bacterium]|nr:hypothetical protein [SAR324 cluster bacterium]